jgi:hypothetical protein
MSNRDDAARVYRHLVDVVLPTGQVTTYGDVSDATGIRLGPQGAPLTGVLYELFRICDEREVPPITAIVVQKDSAYDRGRHGIVGGGYLTAEAGTPNLARRFRPPEFEQRITNGKLRLDPLVGAAQFQSMVERHQDSVWDFRAWPAEIDALG